MATTHAVTITSNDGEAFTFACDDYETLLEGAARAGIALPAICREGNCGACVGSCRDGQYDMPYYSPAALSPADAANGKMLMCQTFPRSPMTVAVDAPARLLTAGPIPRRTAVVTANTDIGGGVHHLALEIVPDDNGDIGPSFEPGQYMELEIPGSAERRAYSLANAPNWEGKLAFLIRLRADGKMSTWLQKVAAVGDPLVIIGPKGGFVLQAGGLTPRRFVAGGTGLAPMLAMLRQMVEFGETSPCHLYFGVNGEGDLFALDVIADLQTALPGLLVTVCLQEPGTGWEGFRGSPAEALARDLAQDLERGVVPEVYVCGPPGLIEATEAATTALNLPKDKLFAERFSPT